MSNEPFDPEEILRWKYARNKYYDTPGEYYRRYVVDPPTFTSSTSSNIADTPVTFREERVRIQPIETEWSLEESPYERAFEKIHEQIKYAKIRLEGIEADMIKEDEPAIKDEEFTFDPEALDI